MTFDLVVRDGVVIDGTGRPGFHADVAVDGQEIRAIGPGLARGRHEIDARGLVVAPGFIDAHTHMDLFLVLYPHGNPVVNFGVTTVVIGDCGASCAPVPVNPEPVQVLVAYLRRVLDGYVDDTTWQWRTFPEYLGYLAGRVGINVAALMPHSPVRLSVMEEAAYQREALPHELAAMKKIVAEGFEAGAIGFSTSPRGGPAIHAGTPSTVASRDEIVELANAVSRHGGLFQFNGFNNLLDPDSGYGALVDRIPAALIGNEFRIYAGAADKARASLAFMEEQGRRGKKVYGVVIPYEHIRRFGVESCLPFEGLPSWESIAKPIDELPRHLAAPELRWKIEQERMAGAGTPAFPEWRGWDRIVFDRMHDPALAPLEGQSVEAIARATGKLPRDAFFDTWLRDHLRSRLIYVGFANADERTLAEMIRSPHGLLGTDAGAHLDRFFWYGMPARVLGYWCRDKKVLTLEQAVWKLTGHPASVLGLNRGRLAAGLPADLTIFDPDTIGDLVSERIPARVDEHEVHRHPPGIRAVVVNGTVVVDGGQCLDVYPGKVTRQELCGAV